MVRLSTLNEIWLLSLMDLPGRVPIRWRIYAGQPSIRVQIVTGGLRIHKIKAGAEDDRRARTETGAESVTTAEGELTADVIPEAVIDIAAGVEVKTEIGGHGGATRQTQEDVRGSVFGATAGSEQSSTCDVRKTWSKIVQRT
jgi:hypothetical protein